MLGTKKTIMFHVIGNCTVGLGHVFRTLTLAKHLKYHHEIVFLTNKENDLALNLVNMEGYSIISYSDNPIQKIEKSAPDLLINDILDTTVEYMNFLRKRTKCKIVNFEDMGEGSELADVVINALYPGRIPHDSFYTGHKFYCIREEFNNSLKKIVFKEVKCILVTYGGTDPNNLTLKTIKGLSRIGKSIQINVILGLGYKNDAILYEYLEKKMDLKIHVFKHVANMAEFIYASDLAFSSAGRTMYEIASIGVPAVITSQNYREITHTFGHPYNGFINLGYHKEVRIADYHDVAIKLINDFELRKRMNKRMLQHDLSKGLERVLSLIFECIRD